MQLPGHSFISTMAGIEEAVKPEPGVLHPAPHKTPTLLLRVTTQNGMETRHRNDLLRPEALLLGVGVSDSPVPTNTSWQSMPTGSTASQASLRGRAEGSSRDRAPPAPSSLPALEKRPAEPGEGSKQATRTRAGLSWASGVLRTQTQEGPLNMVSREFPGPGQQLVLGVLRVQGALPSPRG